MKTVITTYTCHSGRHCSWF